MVIMDNFSSEQYRIDSNEEEVRSSQLYNDYTPSAIEYAHHHDVPLDEAFQHVLQNDGHDAEEVKWTRIPLNETDTVVGDKIKAKNLSIVCNSILTGRYNDTYVAAINGEDSTSVTYRQLSSQHNTHSGDKHTPYGGRGLRHVISFRITDEPNIRTFVMSAPWNAGNKDNVETLTETKPILEIRVDNDGELKRYIIPQDFSGGERHTACASAMVTRDGEFWNVKILQKFINGYADDVPTSISDLKQINFQVDEPSVVCDDEVPSFVLCDDVPSSMPDVVYCDEVPSFVPSDCYSNPVLVEQRSSDYEVEF